MLLFAARQAGVDFQLLPATVCVPCETQHELRPAGSETLQAVTRGSVMHTVPPTPPPSHQQQLDDAVGKGIFVVDENEMLAGCQRCSRFQRTCINLTNPAWLAHAATHYGTHPDTSSMRTLDAFGFGTCSSRLCDDVPVPVASLDYSSRCHGFWLPTVIYDGATYDATLINEDWRPGNAWYVDPGFRASVEYSRDEKGLLLFPEGCQITWQEEALIATGTVLGVAGTPGLLGLCVRPDSTCRPELLSKQLISDMHAPWLMIHQNSVSAVSINVSRPYRHLQCGWFCIDIATGEKLPNLMCRQCALVPQLADFKARLILRANSFGHPAQECRIDRLPTVPQIIDVARHALAERQRWKFNCTIARKMLGRSTARERSMKERLEAQLLTGDLAGLAADLRYCQEHDRFKGKAVALNFLKDVVHSIRLGSSNRNMRWHESTKRLNGVLKNFGGPRSQRLLRLNVGAPSDRTVHRCWNRDIFRYPSGDAESIFIQLAKQLKPKVASLGLLEGESLPCEFQFDETPVLPELTYSESRDAVLGTCGWGGQAHECDPEFAQRPESILGDDEETGMKIDQLCDGAVRAGYLRLVVLKPLSIKLPRMIVSLSPSCNRFCTVDVQQQWVRLDECFDKHIKPLGFTRSSHGSDGDGRYFAAQKANMTDKPTWASGEATSHWADQHRQGTPFRIEHEAFAISGLTLPNRTITNIEIQDCRHDVKKLVSWLFNGKTLRRGDSLVTANHIILMFECFTVDRHHVRKQDAYRHDPQDFIGPIRLSSVGARDCLKKMQAVHVSDFDGSQHGPVKTEGTIEYLDLIANFTRIHLGTVLQTSSELRLQATSLTTCASGEIISTIRLASH